MNRSPFFATVALAVAGLGCAGCVNQAATTPTASSAATSVAGAPAPTGATTPAAASTSAQATSRPTVTVTVHPTVAPTTPPAGASGQGAGMVKLNANITSAGQVSQRLSATSSGFRSYVTSLLAEQQKTATAKCPAELDVNYYWHDDLALGGAGSCGGYLTVWLRANGGAWQEMGFNGDLKCADMRAKGVPHAIPVSTGFKCYDEPSGTMVAYVPKA